jgi:hypothetical protein
MSESERSTEPAPFEGAEPTRWLDDPSTAASLRGDLALGASATAGGLDYAATLTALRGAIAAQTGALAPAALASKSLGLKIALGGVLAIGAAAAWWVSRDEGARNDVVATHEVAGPVVVEPVAPTKPALVARAPELPTPVVADPIPEPPTAVVDPSPVALPTEKAKKAKPPESDDDRFLREAQLVAQAKKQLGTSPEQALASTKKHGREFPKGALVEEARAIEIRAPTTSCARSVMAPTQRPCAVRLRATTTHSKAP